MEEEKWKFTETDPKWTGESEQSFRVALIDELDQLNKTLSVIASNQECFKKITVTSPNRTTLQQFADGVTTAETLKATKFQSPAMESEMDPD